MIPMNPDTRLKVSDEKGNVFELRYVTDEHQEEYDRLIGLIEEREIDGKKESFIAKENTNNYHVGIINLFLVGWSGTEFPEFPKERPSRYFIGREKIRMVELIDKNIPELIGFGSEDAKN